MDVGDGFWRDQASAYGGLDMTGGFGLASQTGGGCPPNRSRGKGVAKEDAR